MAWTALLVLMVMSLHHWLLEPLLQVGTGLFEGRWLAWGLLLVLIWITAGARDQRR